MAVMVEQIIKEVVPSQHPYAPACAHSASVPAHISIKLFVRFFALELSLISGLTIAFLLATGVQRVVVSINAKLRAAVEAVSHLRNLSHFHSPVDL
jgi:hypothetical protein